MDHIANSNSCLCAEGYFDDGTNLVCGKCVDNCLSCTDDAAKCVTCHPNQNRTVFNLT